MNTSEIEAFDGEHLMPFAVDSPWFRGQADVTTFSIEEMLATKLRALLQRDKARDLLDLGHALNIGPNLDTSRVVRLFLAYLGRSKLQISRAEAERRMFAKLDNPRFMRDVRPLLAPDFAREFTPQVTLNHFGQVLSRLIVIIPGTPWGRHRVLTTSPHLR